MDILKNSFQEEMIYVLPASTCVLTHKHSHIFPQFYFRILHNWAFYSNAEYLPQRMFSYNHNNMMLY